MSTTKAPTLPSKSSKPSKPGKPSQQRRRREYPVYRGPEAVRLLQETGALFHSNWMTHHPLGLILGFEEDGTPVVTDRREQPDCVYSERDFVTGWARIQTYLKEQGGQETISARHRILGYRVQPIPPSIERS